MHRDVIIIGGNHHNTLGVLRALGIEGLKGRMHLILKAEKNSFICYSKFINKKNIHFITEDDEIPPLLIEISNSLSNKPIVICCGDHFIHVVDSNYDTLKEFAILPNAQGCQNRISYYLTKTHQSEVAKNCGLNVPGNVISSIEDLNPNSICLPCIIKPINSINGGKADIKICKSNEEISEYKKSYSENHKIIIEQYINKTMEFQLIGCSLEQQIIIPGYTNIIRQPQNTNTGYLKYSPLSDGVISQTLIKNVCSFIRQIGYKGLFSVEFIRDKDGKDYFLEINMRNDGNAYCVTSAGVNLPYIWYKYCDDKNATITEPINFEKPIYWMPETDAKFIKNIGLSKWILQWINANSHAITDIHDIIPIMRLIFNKIISKLHV